MLWSKQFYHYDVDKWLEERGSDPFKATRKAAPRNDHWHHMYNGDIISMPDKWEYPWYAAWDLAFHVLALTLVDVDFGKQQLQVDAARALPAPQRPDSGLRVELRRRQSAGACLVHHLHLPPGKGAERGRGHEMAQELLPEAALELHLVGQPQGPFRAQRLRGRLPGARQHRRVRSQRAAAHRRLSGTGRRHRLDGALRREHARNRHRAGDDRRGLRGHGAQVPRTRHCGSPRRWCTWAAAPGMWDEEDGFFYDVLRLPDGQAQRLKVRSMVGLLPLCAATVFERELLAKYPEIAERFQWFMEARPELARRYPRPDEGRRRRPPPRLPSWTKPSSAACWRRCSTRTSS